MKKRKIIFGLIVVAVVLSLFRGGAKDKEKEVSKEENTVTETLATTQDNTEETTVAEATTTEATTEEEIATTEAEEKSDGKVTPSFKDAMDSYEAFFDEYVEFMKEYSESDDTLGMLSEYSDYMNRYADFMEKMDAIKEDELSAADYAITFSEINERLNDEKYISENTYIITSDTLPLKMVPIMPRKKCTD